MFAHSFTSVLVQFIHWSFITVKSLQQLVRFCSPDEAIVNMAKRQRFLEDRRSFFLAAVLNCFQLQFVPK